jgi:DNA-binding IclR family transcriptional regulator
MRTSRSKSAPVGVIGKVLRILELLNQSPNGLQLREIATKTAINKSTAHRFLSHLEAEGYLFRDEAGTYMLGARLARLGTGVSLQAMLCRICRPVLENLRSATDETVNLAMLDGTEIVYLDVLESQNTFRLASPVGQRRPAVFTSLGKAIIANLEDAQQKEEILLTIRAEPSAARRTGSISKLRKELRQICEQGFSLDDEESVTGARCVGAAVFGADNRVVAGISISAPVVRMTRKRLPFFSAEVCKAAREISRRLGDRMRRGEHADSVTPQTPICKTVRRPTAAIRLVEKSNRIAISPSQRIDAARAAPAKLRIPSR